MQTLWWFPVLIFCSVTESFTQTRSSHSSSTTAQVSVKILGNSQKTSVFITKSNLLNYFRDTLAGSKTDASGHSALLFPLLEPTFAEIRIGNRKSNLYLTPGDDLVIHVDLANSNFLFTGKGAETNNYLSQSEAIRQKNIIYKGQYINELKTALFINHLDTLAKAFGLFHSQYLKTHPLPKHVSNLLKANNTLFIHSFAQNYADVYFGTFEQRDKMPKRLKELTNHIYFDTTFLHTGMVNYLAMLQDYYYKKFYNPLFKRTDTPQKIDSIRHILPQTAHTTIQKSTLPPPFKEFFLAKNCDVGLEMLGIIPATESIFSDFKTHYHRSSYQDILQKRYNKWLSVARGTPAADFTGETPDGQKLSLSDLKGKVVYVDVWATWCGPCRAEFPKAKELKMQFEGNNDVVFLYASVDGDPNAWQKFLRTANAPQGIHIRLSPVEQRKIVEDYQCGGGVPKYFLIDQQGRIVSTVAPKPSSGKAESEIRALLK